MTATTTDVDVSTEQSSSPKRTYPQSPQRILVADDEHLVAAGLKSNLVDLGYVVIGPASNGEEAINLARTARPDLALLDIRMPHTDGLAAGEVIFRQFGIPVVMISAFSDPEYVRSSNKFRTFGYLLKPITLDELRVTIEVAWSTFTDFVDHKDNIDRLKERLEHRKAIEEAKWLIVQRKNVTEPEAMKLLQRQARNNRRTLIDVARALLENEKLFGAGEG